MTDSSMLTDTASGNGLKRKAEHDEKRAGRSETASPVKADVEHGSTKKAKKSTDMKGPLIDLKKRRITLKQDPRPLESLLRHDCFTSLLREFHEYLDAQSEPLQLLPDKFHALIVLAGHESSAATTPTLVKALRTLLEKPSFDFDESQGSSSSRRAGTISTTALTSAISLLLTQISYGFTAADLLPASACSTAPPPPKLPSALQYTRWEASPDLCDRYLPIQARDVMRARHEERQRLRTECEALVDGLDVVARMELLGVTPQKKKERDSSIDMFDADPVPARAPSNSKERSASPTKMGKAKKPEDQETVRKREEKLAKKADRDRRAAEKQAAKDHADREKQKQKQTMTNFFIKPAAEPSTSRQESPVKAAASSLKSDYQRTFLPFARKPDVECAPVNWFAHRDMKRRQQVGFAVEVDAPDVKNWVAKDFLNDHLNRWPKIKRRQLPEGLKSAPPDLSVREVWDAHIDAELSGTQDPRKVLDQLHDRERFPWKTLLFAGQNRPPYSGTFTKRSAVVGPRTPFAQDPIFEYGYDSDEEWEDAGGDDVDEQPKDDAPEEEDDFGSEEEGEFDDWLDDSEDVVMASQASDEVRIIEPDGTPATVKPVIKKERVVKRVQKLPIIIKGPVWETTIGEEGTEGLDAFRIQLLNNAPFPIDPFRWQSAEPQQTLTAQRGFAVVGLSKKVPCLFETKASTAPPPAAIIVPVANPVITGEPQVTKLKARPAVPKMEFPNAYLGEMLQIVDGSLKSQADLSAELRQRFEKITTKSAIEARLKIVAKKARGKGTKWVVTPEAWREAGVPPPTC